MTESNYSKFIEVPNIQNYIDHANNYFSVFAHLGKQSTFSFELRELTISEKHQGLDVESSLMVSHHLTEEIFRKVNDFTTRFVENKDQVKYIFDGYSKAANKAVYLQTLIVDLLKGTHKFEERIIESIINLKGINPMNVPKLRRVELYLQTLTDKQTRLADRFDKAKDFFKLKDVIKKMRHLLTKFEKSVSKILRLVSSPEFDSFFNTVDSLTLMLNKVDLTKDLERVI